jgi:DNA-binding MarR family transcriptional regulator
MYIILIIIILFGKYFQRLDPKPCLCYLLRMETSSSPQDSEAKASRCAALLLDVAPQLMQTLRVEMRAGRPPELTVPQFRTLVFFQLHPGAALSQAAEHLGLALPAASKVVEGLVSRGFMLRDQCETDRRRVVISLTDKGAEVLEGSRTAAMAVFSRRLSGLSRLELDVLHSVLDTLLELICTPCPAPSLRPPATPGGDA